jgi:hypothetical protein
MNISPHTIQKACDSLAQILIQKNHDYGNSVEEQYEEYGLMSLNLRLEDKLRRLKNLSKKEQAVKEESVADTLLDSAGYALLGFIILSQEPTKRPIVAPRVTDKKPPYMDLDD